MPISTLSAYFWAQNDARRHLATGHKAPERDQQFARQRHDHRLPLAARTLGSRSIPLGQGAVFLEQQETPCELDHTAAHSRISCSGKPSFSASASALVGRTGKARVARYCSSISQV